MTERNPRPISDRARHRLDPKTGQQLLSQCTTREAVYSGIKGQGTYVYHSVTETTAWDALEREYELP
ncbi:MAG: hypothetical protein NFCOHLIN_01083 [Gammaproteobacteria bacterium]|nr:hypothetical protein [Gammaproteobacteria bacterium]